MICIKQQNYLEGYIKSCIRHSVNEKDFRIRMHLQMTSVLDECFLRFLGLCSVERLDLLETFGRIQTEKPREVSPVLSRVEGLLSPLCNRNVRL
jgi:hypothetical protein